MFTDLFLHTRPLGNGTKEVLGIFLGTSLKWVRVYPSIVLKKDHELLLDRSHLYNIPKSGVGETLENCHIATYDPSLKHLMVFKDPPTMLAERKKKYFEKWEKFCGSIVRTYYLCFQKMRSLVNKKQ